MEVCSKGVDSSKVNRLPLVGQQASIVTAPRAGPTQHAGSVIMSAVGTVWEAGSSRAIRVNVMVDLLKDVFDLLVLIAAFAVKSYHVHVIGMDHSPLLMLAIDDSGFGLNDMPDLRARKLLNKGKYMEVVLNLFEPIL